MEGVFIEYRSTCCSSDGSKKYVFDVPAKGVHQAIRKRKVGIESAFFNIPNREDNKPEYVLCLSSQAGCVYNCRICANMFDSFYGCLSPDEINEQIGMTLSQDGNLEKILSKDAVEYALMAMGEPLYGNNVIKAIQKHKPYVADTKFSLSTVGAPGTIDRLTNSDLPYPVRLELSLHFPTDRTRREWLVYDEMFFKKDPELTISTMLDEAERYARKHHGKITLNYVLIDGINNMEHNTDEILKILEGRSDIFYVKVMKPNLTSSFVFSWGEIGCLKQSKHYPPKEFKERLQEKGIKATLFESKGTDIAAGCGMMTTRFRGKRGIVRAEEFFIPQANPSRLGF